MSSGKGFTKGFRVQGSARKIAWRTKAIKDQTTTANRWMWRSRCGSFAVAKLVSLYKAPTYFQVIVDGRPLSYHRTRRAAFRTAEQFARRLEASQC